MGDELTLIYPVSKLLDVMTYDVNNTAGVDDGPSPQLPYVRVVSRRSIPCEPPAGSGGSIGGSNGGSSGGSDGSASLQLTELELEVVVPEPCWGTLKISGVDLVRWSIVPGHWYTAAAFLAKQQGGSGSALVTAGPSQGGARAGRNGGSSSEGPAIVSSLITKFTSEHRAGPLHWRVVLQYLPAVPDGQQAQQQQQPQQGQGQGQQGQDGLLVQLHVGNLNKTPELLDMAAHMPAWATLSYRATVLVSNWSF